MKARTVSLGLAAGLFALAVWFAFRPALPPPKRSSPAVRSEQRGAAPQIVGGVPGPATMTPTLRSAVGTPTTSPIASAGIAPGRPSISPEDAVAANATTTNASSRSAEIEVGKVKLMVRDFHTILGENPVGTNAEIMHSLMGNNPKQATLGPPEGMSLNANGELVDQWNTPYFFHQLTKDVMEVRSAGPDKKMWTADDVILR